MFQIKGFKVSLLKTLILNSVLLGSLLIVTSCGRGKSYRTEEPNVELIQDMMAGPQIKAQEADENGKATVRQPPTNTVSRNRYVPEDLKLEDAEKMKNPLNDKDLAAEIAIKYENLGQEKYDINCAVCHGVKGDGLGPLVTKRGDLLLKKPPSILDSTYKNYSDGRMYYVITYGWGLMGNYGTQITDEKERWAVVNYIRQLQKLNSTASNQSKPGDK